jgi:DNA polymerase III alpha subunit
MKGMQKGGELNPSGCSLEAAEFLWFKFILPYGSYGFNLSHSIAYSFIAYETVWLKANFPGEFYAALLSHESDQDKANTTITEAKSAGIRFLPPDINKSTSTFTITDPTTIVYSLTCMKGVGDSAVEKIVRSRQYKNMVDFLGRSDVNASVIKALIMGGAFDNAFTEEHVTRKNYYDFFEDARGKLNRQTDRFLRQALLRKFNFQELKGEEKKKATLEGTYESPANFHKRMLETNEEYQAEYKRRELEEIAKFTYDWNEPITENSKGLVTAVERATKDDRNKWNMSEQFDFEEEIYGTTLSGHRLDPYYVSEKDFIQGTKNSGWDILNLAEDLNLYEKGQEVYIFCLGIKEATKFPYRNNPKAFVRSFEIEDRNGKGRITVFDQTFINLLKSNNLCLSILSKKLPHRPVMILKCKIDENKSMRQLVLDSVVQWVNEIEIKEEIKSIKMKELKIEEEVSRLAE